MCINNKTIISSTERVIVTIIIVLSLQNILYSTPRYIPTNSAVKDDIKRIDPVNCTTYKIVYYSPISLGDDTVNYMNGAYVAENENTTIIYRLLPFEVSFFRKLPSITSSKVNLGDTEKSVEEQVKEILCKISEQYKNQPIDFVQMTNNQLMVTGHLDNKLVNKGLVAQIGLDKNRNVVSLITSYTFGNKQIETAIKINFEQARDMACKKAINIATANWGFAVENTINDEEYGRPFLQSDIFGIQRLVYKVTVIVPASNHFKSKEELDTYITENKTNLLKVIKNGDLKEIYFDVDAASGEIMPSFPNLHSSLDCFKEIPRVYLDNQRLHLNYMPIIVGRRPYLYIGYLNGTKLWCGQVKENEQNLSCEIRYGDNIAYINKNEVIVQKENSIVVKGNALWIDNDKLFMDYESIEKLTGDKLKWNVKDNRLDIYTDMPDGSNGPYNVPQKLDSALRWFPIW